MLSCILQTLTSLTDILRERPTSSSLKTYAVAYMATKTKSFEYTRNVLTKLNKQARDEVARLGGNPGVEKILDMLVVKEDGTDVPVPPPEGSAAET